MLYGLVGTSHFPVCDLAAHAVADGTSPCLFTPTNVSIDQIEHQKKTKRNSKNEVELLKEENPMPCNRMLLKILSDHLKNFKDKLFPHR